jgi:hypothetical protein
VAARRTFVNWPTSNKTKPLEPEALSVAARARLLARADQRGRRLQATERHASADRFWLDTELRLTLPLCHPKVGARWQRAVAIRLQHAERTLEAWRQLAAWLDTYQPEPEQWLRRQLGTLAPGEREP